MSEYTSDEMKAMLKGWRPPDAPAEAQSELKTILSVMKRLTGERWKQATGEYRAILLAAMEGSGDTNPLACAIPIAQAMSDRGQNPLMLLAVATEMSEASNTKLTDTSASASGLTVTVIEHPAGFLLRLEHDEASMTLNRDEAFDLHEKLSAKLGGMPVKL
jgi:hypothetical protein